MCCEEHSRYAHMTCRCFSVRSTGRLTVWLFFLLIMPAGLVLFSNYADGSCALGLRYRVSGWGEWTHAGRCCGVLYSWASGHDVHHVSHVCRCKHRYTCLRDAAVRMCRKSMALGLWPCPHASNAGERVKLGSNRSRNKRKFFFDI